MTPGRLKIWNDLAGQWEYPPGVGSQPGAPIWRGPYTITYTDTPANNTVIDVTDLNAGDLFLGVLYAVITPWVGPEFPFFDPVGFLLGTGGAVPMPQNTDWGGLGALVDVAANSILTTTTSNPELMASIQQNSAGTSKAPGPGLMLADATFQVNYKDLGAGTAATAGEALIYVCTATPVAP